MGIINCNIHGWSGTENLSPSAYSIFNGENNGNIIETCIVWDGIEFPFFAAKHEEINLLFFENESHTIESEERLDAILEKLVPVCGKCLHCFLNKMKVAQKH